MDRHRRPTRDHRTGEFPYAADRRRPVGSDSARTRSMIAHVRHFPHPHLPTVRVFSFCRRPFVLSHVALLRLPSGRPRLRRARTPASRRLRERGRGNGLGVGLQQGEPARRAPGRIAVSRLGAPRRDRVRADRGEVDGSRAAGAAVLHWHRFAPAREGEASAVRVGPTARRR